MAFDRVLADRVRTLLPPGTVERRMMGAVCFMAGGHMACGVSGDGVMVRVGPEAAAAALAEPHVRPLAIGGGRAPAGFVVVDPPGWPTEAALAAWLRRGLDFAATLPARPQRA